MGNNKKLVEILSIVSMETCFCCYRGETVVDISSNRFLIVLLSENTFDRKNILNSCGAVRLLLSFHSEVNMK